MTAATRRRGLASAAVLSILVLSGACSADSGGDGDSMSAPAGAVDPAGGADDGSGGGGGADSKVESEADSNGALAVADGAEAPVAADAPADVSNVAEGGEAAEDQKLISNGAVQLKSDDVGKTIFDVRNVVDTYAGEVEANATETDDEGDPLRARLKLRVPTAQFDNVMQDLEGVATLIASSGNTEDVTTEVLDRGIRIQIQRRSIERISLLLDRAVSIRDVVAIESQLSQRQADLAVLEKQQRYLDDQTAMATINVSVERVKAKKPTSKPEKKDDDSGFFAGLDNGWDGLKTFGEGLATVFGVLLPWLVVGGVLAIPGVPLYRRLRRREVGAAPSPQSAP
jgi:hypothetical protein